MWINRQTARDDLIEALKRLTNVQNSVRDEIEHLEHCTWDSRTDILLDDLLDMERDLMEAACAMTRLYAR